MNETLVGMQAVGATSVGQRKHNEDAFQLDSSLGLSIVADGVGGHDAGEVASAITCEVISREVAVQASLKDAVRAANREVMAAVEQGRGKAGMASTVVAVRLTGSDYQIAWVGDSRVYLWDGQLSLLTQDHSYVQALLEQGRITLAEARDHPRKNVIVQAIGLQDDSVLQVGENAGALGSGQMLLLCSDGLSDVVDSSRIAEILMSGGSAQKRCQELVDAAVSAGGRDNITVVLLVGTEQLGSQSTARPEIVWNYNPDSGEYSGLVEQEVTSPSVRRVMPKGASLETTQMVPAEEIRALQKAAAQKLGRRRMLLIAIAAIAVVSLVYSLGIDGQALTGVFK